MKPFLYERLIRSLLIEISSGLYGEGDRFLSIRKICGDWAVGQKTVDRALAVLVARGILCGSNRSRYRLATGAINLARIALRDYPADALPPPQKWRERKRALAGKAKIQGVRIAAILDRSSEYDLIRREGLPTALSFAAFKQGVERYYLLAFFQTLNRSLAEGLFYLDDGSEAGRANILQQLKNDSIDGVVVFRRSLRSPRSSFPAGLKKCGLPIVAVMDDCQGVADCAIDFNNVAAGYEAMKVLWRHGHRSIWILASEKPDDQYAERTLGALHFHSQQKVSANDRVLTLKAPEMGMRATIAEAWKSAEIRPTAILSTGVHFYIRSADFFKQSRIRIPRQLSMLGFAIPELVPRPFQHLCLMEQDFSALGSRSAEAILSLIAGQPVPSAISVEIPFHSPAGRRTSLRAIQ